MAFRSRIFGAGKALILIAALVATYIAFAVGSLQYALRSQEVQVPDLTNRSTADASAIISDLGLSLKVDEMTRLDQRVPCTDRLGHDAEADRQRSRRTIGRLRRDVDRIPCRCDGANRGVCVRVRSEQCPLRTGKDVHGLLQKFHTVHARQFLEARGSVTNMKSTMPIEAIRRVQRTRSARMSLRRRSSRAEYTI